ncbi:fimbrial chaperone [Salmonella enterica]|uniref:Fimbrial chaperone n=6 Tax=Salmonella enterica TaxID=28901 RepID=A0A624B3K0_SALMO|nr:fimbrial chaperone [Salmonella enterica]EAC2144544.1 fimbrial chaperone [Salmonella enterica subsp. enterica]EBZ6048498.1 fimbrial chaperone [Salmonella enterica subsp. enterica serovar Texas]ECS7543839.1 fimbrial chaperone [Salmonella enterica subsp. enterica serovar Denver]ECZ5259955.1 fimbrial chaperone [Salmonella enterica subsp. enterica serovar Montevideo]EDH9622403.1 fimbrial chaperone [Salmonella enterica subsp. enterica serovar Austin]EDP9256616.1 fimbrial chaperone [Salmonella en
MRLFKTCITAMLLSSAFCVSHSAFADIVIAGTRVIYPESAKDVTVKMENRGNKPLLVQTWLDDGRDTTNPQELKLPFIITPPVSRVDPAKGQTVRITWLGQPLPKDKETMYWFNVLEVPPKMKGSESQNMLQLAFRTRIKMFFRPNGLEGSPAVAASRLKWSKGTNALIARNDSPFYVSLAKIEATAGGKKVQLEPHVVAPFASQSYELKGQSSANINKLTYTSINDFGGAEEHEATVN